MILLPAPGGSGRAGRQAQSAVASVRGAVQLNWRGSGTPLTRFYRNNLTQLARTQGRRGRTVRRPVASGIEKRVSRHIPQEVCPFNVKFAEEAAEPGYAARGPGERPVGVEANGPAEPGSESAVPLHPGTDAPALVELLRLALLEEGWEAFSRGSAIRRAGRAGFTRNVCVAMGNWLAAVEKGGWGRTEDTSVEMLVRALSDPEPLVRGHAAWALGQTPSNRAREALGEQLASERDRGVREELELALTA